MENKTNFTEEKFYFRGESIETSSFFANTHNSVSIESNLFHQLQSPKRVKKSKKRSSSFNEKTLGNFFNRNEDSDTCKDRFKASIENKLRKLKENMLNKIEKMKDILDTSYDTQIEKIKKCLKTRARRITQVFHQEDTQSLHKLTYKNIDEKIQEIFEIHDKIDKTIETNFEILQKFLEKCDLSHKNPSEFFLNDNAEAILNSSMFSKINFEKLNLVNLLENEKIPLNFKKLIYQDTLNKFSMISIKKSKNYEFDKSLMRDNHSILEKLNLKNLDHSEFVKLFHNSEFIKYRKLKEINIENSTLESSMFNSLFPNTEKIFISNSILKLNFTNLAKDFSKLKILSIRNSNLNNKNFQNLIEDFSNCKEILDNLEIIDLTNNNLTQIDLSPLSNITRKLFNLQILILNKNKIFKFKQQNLQCLPSLRYLDISSNNFTNGKDFSDLKEKSRKSNNDILVLANNNFFILNSPKENSEYIDYLNKKLKNYDFFLKKLNFTKVFNIFNKHLMLDISLHTNIQISLKKINLTFCSLDSSTIIFFLKNISGFINLKTINISNNNIDDTFFELYINEGLFNYLENMAVLNLSNNRIGLSRLDYFDKLIKNQKKLKKIYLGGNSIILGEDYFNDNFKNENELRIILKNKKNK